MLYTFCNRLFVQSFNSRKLFQQIRNILVEYSNLKCKFSRFGRTHADVSSSNTYQATFALISKWSIVFSIPFNSILGHEIIKICLGTILILELIFLVVYWYWWSNQEWRFMYAHTVCWITESAPIERQRSIKYYNFQAGHSGHFCRFFVQKHTIFG